jgi:hypothetical protein
MARVVKSCGYIIDCDGENGGEEPEPSKKELLKLGFEYSHTTLQLFKSLKIP